VEGSDEEGFSGSWEVNGSMNGSGSGEDSCLDGDASRDGEIE
jgi:hypothetical protein